MQLKFPIFRKHKNGNTLYKVLSNKSALIVSGLIHLVYRIEICNNKFIVNDDALNDDVSEPCTPQDFEDRYNEAKQNIELLIC